MRITTLNKIPIGTTVTIHSFDTEDAESNRLLDLGFVAGAQITPVFYSVVKDPTAFLVKDTIIVLRNETSEKINVFT